jgi:4-diphosphocytidyl-2C-methyl-D-erythritol kinase
MNNFGTRPQFPLENWGPAENDFEKVVFARWPMLARLKRQLLRAGAEAASLTGSGSDLYAVFASARQLASAKKTVPTGWRAFSTRMLPRVEYERRVVVEKT